jgi:hypothetical protein
VQAVMQHIQAVEPTAAVATLVLVLLLVLVLEEEQS